jgi:hypothetical protein
MRLSTFGKLRIIGWAEDFPSHIGLPRGCLDDTGSLQILRYHIRNSDERFEGAQIDVVFKGNCTLQEEAGLKCLRTRMEFYLPQLLVRL